MISLQLIKFDAILTLRLMISTGVFLETLDAVLKCMIDECNGKRSIFISMAQHTLVSATRLDCE